MGVKGAALLVALLVGASVLAAIRSCSADANTTTLPIKPKASPPSPGDTSRKVAAVFPLEGNVYPRGGFDVQMSFGNSHNLYSMNIDSGSDVPWVQCQMPTQAVYPQPGRDKIIPCDDPRCKAVLASTGSKQCKSKGPCNYQVQYQDSSAKGVLIADTLTLHLTNGSTVRLLVAFGCGQWVKVTETGALTDGILGIGFGEISIVSQLSSQGLFGKITGHCLNSNGGGFLFLGDNGRLPSGITWVPMIPSDHYSPGPASLFWDNQPLGSQLITVWLDSGTTFTYFGLHPYNSLISTLNGYVSTQPLKRAYDDPSLPYCWRGPQKFRTIADAQRYFKILELRFANGAAPMKLPPVNYLIISSKGNACLGILNGTQVGLKPDENVIGDISLLDLMLIYDNDKKRIGWASTNFCRV
ncbi:aspartic proteinase Asp1-like [Elaeis guineensis]|uniref:Aspartic proteinase Asp1-like n=1 Tax=Elaeis guineensis var. tenera TaxID=51953 RepID=A0A6I9QN70_ELAGV|nr:aspartic proteinase Asp1-like [Elaeis guineensis]